MKSHPPITIVQYWRGNTWQTTIMVDYPAGRRSTVVLSEVRFPYELCSGPELTGIVSEILTYVPADSPSV